MNRWRSLANGFCKVNIRNNYYYATLLFYCPMQSIIVPWHEQGDGSGYPGGTILVVPSGFGAETHLRTGYR